MVWSGRLKHEVWWPEDMTLKGPFQKGPLESCGNADTQWANSYVCTTLASLTVALFAGYQQHACCKSRKMMMSRISQLTAGNILVLTGEGGCFLSTAAKSSSLYSFPGWLSTCCLILFSVQKWKSIGFVTWPTVLFTGCPKGKRTCKV